MVFGFMQYYFNILFFAATFRLTVNDLNQDFRQKETGLMAPACNPSSWRG